MSVSTLLTESARFVSTLRTVDLPDSSLTTVRLGFTDAIACLLAGRNEPVTQTLISYLNAESCEPQNRVPALLGAYRLMPEHAALLDATAAHALDYDDFAFSNHPSSVMVPAILSAASLAGRNGAAMASAYVAGYEVWAELMSREPDHLHGKGWHPTAVFGPIGAAAAVCHVLCLDQAQTANALGLAVAYAGGVMGNFGTMAKPYHAGRAAEAGLRVALLAKHGMTASPAAFDGPGGLLAALSPQGRADHTSQSAFGERWRICETALNIKRYPTVGASQRIIDGLTALVAATPIDLDAISTIAPRVSEKYALLMNISDPRTPAEAKFSLAFACAAALRWGRVGLNELAEDKIHDPLLRTLIGKVKVNAVNESDPVLKEPAPYDMTNITLIDGTSLETDKVARYVGHADNPLSADGLHDKFLNCACYGGVAMEVAQRLFEIAQRIDTLADTAELAALRY